MAGIRMPVTQATHAKPVIGKAILCMGRTFFINRLKVGFSDDRLCTLILR
ncbi:MULTISPECIES: hypothetical protein [Bacillus]|nr:hypothetical protein [Bacillus glycinifermentans]MBU8788121.1 hypothetical protein [Bacillus glycinifermentans]